MTQDPKDCTRCGGSGNIDYGAGARRICPDCNGTGKACSCNLPKPHEVQPGKTYSYDPNCPVHGCTCDGVYPGGRHEFSCPMVSENEEQ